MIKWFTTCFLLLSYFFSSAQLQAVPNKLINDLPVYQAHHPDLKMKSAQTPKSCDEDTLEYGRYKGTAYTGIGVFDGYSLGQSIVRAADLSYCEAAPFDPARSLGEALLPPSRIYVKDPLALATANLMKGAVPVTSCGLDGALSSLLPTGLGARLQADYEERPPQL